jgi:hypothetical protein
LRQEPLLDVALGVVHPIGGYLQRGYSYVHGALLLPPATKGGLTLSTADHDAIVAWDNATSENDPAC